jgi:hypothetical protein
MLNDILKIANLYDSGLKHVQARRDQWIKKHVELREHLKEVADFLNANAAYKQGFFIDTLHAFNEDNGGTCAEMPSITFRSGSMPMLVSFKNAMGERKEYNEEGFRITFTPTITGQLIVLLFPHVSDINKVANPQYATLSVIDEPAQLTMDIADQIILKGMQGAFYSSFTGMGEPGEAEEPEDGQPTPLQIPKHNPIGFKRYETTEKVS